MRQLIALSAGLALAAFVTAATPTTMPATPATAPATAAPAFTLNDQAGKPVQLADFRGKIVVLEWVNPECPFVQRHYKAGTMTLLAARYKDKGVVWLSINSTHTAGVDYNRKWVEQQKLAYPVLDDHEGVVGRNYGAKTTPHLFVIDAAGQIAYQGAIDDDPAGDRKDRVNYVDQALTELLAGKEVSAPKTTPYGCTVKYSPAK